MIKTRFHTHFVLFAQSSDCQMARKESDNENEFTVKFVENVYSIFSDNVLQ
jgi:hypothetical protein